MRILFVIATFFFIAKFVNEVAAAKRRDFASPEQKPDDVREEALWLLNKNAQHEFEIAADFKIEAEESENELAQLLERFAMTGDEAPLENKIYKNILFRLPNPAGETEANAQEKVKLVVYAETARKEIQNFLREIDALNEKEGSCETNENETKTDDMWGRVKKGEFSDILRNLHFDEGPICYMENQYYTLIYALYTLDVQYMLNLAVTMYFMFADLRDVRRLLLNLLEISHVLKRPEEFLQTFLAQHRYVAAVMGLEEGVEGGGEIELTWEAVKEKLNALREATNSHAYLQNHRTSSLALTVLNTQWNEEQPTPADAEQGENPKDYFARILQNDAKKYIQKIDIMMDRPTKGIMEKAHRLFRPVEGEQLFSIFLKRKDGLITTVGDLIDFIFEEYRMYFLAYERIYKHNISFKGFSRKILLVQLPEKVVMKIGSDSFPYYQNDEYNWEFFNFFTSEYDSLEEDKPPKKKLFINRRFKKILSADYITHIVEK